MKLENTISRLMLVYFSVYFAIAAGQFALFSFMLDIKPVVFIEALAWIALLTAAAGRIPERRAWMALGAAGLLTKMLWIAMVQTPPVSDFSLMYHSAREMMEGGREYLNNIYYRRFPYQTGFTAYQALVLSVFDSVTFLKLVNAFWCAVASLAVYGIAREAFSRKTAVLAMLLHVTLLPLLLMSSVLTNQHIAAAWLYCGLYVWLKFGRVSWFGAGAAGALIAVGQVMRPIGIVVIAAIAVNELIRLAAQRSKREVFGAMKAGVAVAAYWLVFTLAGTILSQTGISPDGLRNNDPLWKFMTGLNAAANGSYSKGDERLLNYGYMNPEKRTALEKEIIRERLTDRRNMVKLPFVKIGKLWADYQPYWFTFPKKSGTSFLYLGWTVRFDEVIGTYRQFERAVFYWLALPAFCGVIRFLRREFADGKKRLIVLVIGAYTFAHLFVEVQPRYMYFLFGPLLAFSAEEWLYWKSRLFGAIRTYVHSR